MQTYTVIGYFTMGRDRGTSILEYVCAESPKDAARTIDLWCERNIRIIAVLADKHEVYRPGTGPEMPPMYDADMPSISAKRQADMIKRALQAKHEIRLHQLTKKV